VDDGAIVKVRRVPLAVTEAAVQLIYANHGEYRRGRSTGRRRGRIVATGTVLGRYDPLTTNRESCYFRIISITEAFTDVLSHTLFEQRLTSQQDLVQRLLEEVERRSAMSWSAREDAFKAFHSVPISQLPRYREFRAGVEVRNAIAHGLGSLTLAQRRKPQLRSQLASIDVRVVDSRIALTEASLHRAVDFSTGLVLDLDNASRS